MTPRTLMAIACFIAGALGVGVAFNGWFGIEAAVIAMSILGFAAIFALSVYLLGAALVLLSHETWIARVVERMKQ